MRIWAYALLGLASIVATMTRSHAADTEQACVEAPPIPGIEMGDRRAAPPATGDRKAFPANLHALTIGISHYGDGRLDLTYPAADATGLAEVLRGQDGGLFGHVDVMTLTDEGATGTAIKRGLKRLLDQVKPGDVAIVYLGGDATTDAGGRLWFLPFDADPDAIDATALSRDSIADMLSDLPTTAILFLDACHTPDVILSAGARCARSVGAAASDFAAAGVVTYSACSGREPSKQREGRGQGAFAEALIEAFKGTGGVSAGGAITTATLDAFLKRRVEELTGGTQHPAMIRPGGQPDVPIALSR